MGGRGFGLGRRSIPAGHGYEESSGSRRASAHRAARTSSTPSMGGPGEVEALAQVAMKGQDPFELVVPLDPLGHRPKVQVARELEDRPRQPRLPGIRAEPVEKPLLCPG
jgi:hypothetical protein